VVVTPENIRPSVLSAGPNRGGRPRIRVLYPPVQPPPSALFTDGATCRILRNSLGGAARAHSTSKNGAA
jgi:hypothetical protein